MAASTTTAETKMSKLRDEWLIHWKTIDALPAMTRREKRKLLCKLFERHCYKIDVPQICWLAKELKIFMLAKPYMQHEFERPKPEQSLQDQQSETKQDMWGPSLPDEDEDEKTFDQDQSKVMTLLETLDLAESIIQKQLDLPSFRFRKSAKDLAKLKAIYVWDYDYHYFSGHADQLKCWKDGDDARDLSIYGLHGVKMRGWHVELIVESRSIGYTAIGHLRYTF